MWLRRTRWPGFLGLTCVQHARPHSQSGRAVTSAAACRIELKARKRCEDMRPFCPKQPSRDHVRGRSLFGMSQRYR